MTFKRYSFLICLFLVAGTVFADYKDDIGYTRLTNELGAVTPSGTNIFVSHIEAPAPTNYMPDISSSEFIGKTIVNISAVTNAVSDHATVVGELFYGNVDSIAPDIQHIDVYHADNWLTNDFLHLEDLTLFPEIETNRIQNLSWVSGGDSNYITIVTRRFDYAIERDGFTAVVSLNNTTSSVIPLIMAHSYNAITVGRISGVHSSGDTTFDEAGRSKPDIVVPQGTVSASSPVVSAAAALLMETSDNNSALTNASKPQCIKALLLAGATKEEFPSWSRTTAKPLDDTYGAGEINIYNSYHILTAGEQDASSTSLVQRIGWDYEYIANSSSNFYFIEAPESNVMTRLSIVLEWNRGLSNGPMAWFDPEPFMSDLNLHLYEASNLVVGALIDSSTSSVDNVEHVYQKHLSPGQYAIEVSADVATNYAIAWYSRVSSIPEFSSITTSNNTLRFETAVTPGINYAIEASTNLLSTNNWARIFTNSSSTNLLIFIDTDSTNHPQRYYRLITDP